MIGCLKMVRLWNQRSLTLQGLNLEDLLKMILAILMNYPSRGSMLRLYSEISPTISEIWEAKQALFSISVLKNL
jgi:hypothetical protein